MKSASYINFNCPKCIDLKCSLREPKKARYASRDVHGWVTKKVYTSGYIRSKSGDCMGCLDVYEERARVIGNILYLLGVRIR
jgi:hypothetical protein